MPARLGVGHPGRPGPDHPGARQMGELRGPPLAEREHVERLTARHDRVRALARPVDEAVAGPQLVRLPRAP